MIILDACMMHVEDVLVCVWVLLCRANIIIIKLHAAVLSVVTKRAGAATGANTGTGVEMEEGRRGIEAGGIGRKTGKK